MFWIVVAFLTGWLTANTPWAKRFQAFAGPKVAELWSWLKEKAAS